MFTVLFDRINEKRNIKTMQLVPKVIEVRKLSLYLRSPDSKCLAGMLNNYLGHEESYPRSVYLS